MDPGGHRDCPTGRVRRRGVPTEPAPTRRWPRSRQSRPGHIYVVEGKHFTTLSHWNIRGAEDLARILWPEDFPEPIPTSPPSACAGVDDMNGTDPPVISAAREVSYEVGAKSLLDGVDLHADSGQLVGLIGPNGAGKSTLLRTIAGILPPRQGAVLLDGAETWVKNCRPKTSPQTWRSCPRSRPTRMASLPWSSCSWGGIRTWGAFRSNPSDDRYRQRRHALTETEKVPTGRSTPCPAVSASASSSLARPGAAAPRAAAGRADFEPGHPSPAKGARTWFGGWSTTGLTAIAAIHDLHMAARYCDRLVLLSGGRVLGRLELPNRCCLPENIESAFGVKSAVYQG